MKKLYHYPAMAILSIFAVLLLLVFELTAFVKLVVFKPELYSEAIGRKAVSDAVYEDLTEYFAQFSAPTGIPPEVFNGAIDQHELADASFDLLTDSLNYLTNKNAQLPEIKYDFESFEKKIVGYIEEYSESNGIEKDDEYYDLIDNTVTVAENQIINHLDIMMLHQLATSRYGKVIHEKSEYVGTAMFASCGLFVIVLMIMIIVDRRHVRDLPYWAGLILAVSSAVLLFPCIYLDKINYFSTFFIRSRHIYLTVTGVFQTVLSRVIRFETVMLLVGLILIVLTVVIHMLYIRYLKAERRRKITSG